MVKKSHRTRAFYQRIFGSSSKCPIIVKRIRADVANSVLSCYREWEFQFILKGKGFYFIAGNKYLFQPNTVLVINPKQAHYFALTPGSMMDKWTLVFLPSFLRDSAMLRALSSVPHQASPTDREAAAMVLLLNRMQDELSRQERHWPEIVRHMVCEYLWLLQRAGARASPPPIIHPLVKQMTDYIEEHFAQRLSVPDMAKQFGYSESYLSHLFKRHTRFGIKHYLLQRRIAEARIQLEKNPGIKIAAVAQQVGFDHFPVFNRMFKMLVGTTATVYSRNC